MDNYTELEKAHGREAAKVYRDLFKNQKTREEAIHDFPIEWVNNAPEWREGFVSELKTNELVWLIDHVEFR